MDKPWMIDEIEFAGAEHLDSEFVTGFDRKQGYPDPSEDLAVLAAHDLGQASTVIDFGAGSGQFALSAAAQFGRVIAVDVSPVMVQSLRLRASEAGITNLECVAGGFLTYDHKCPPVDAVYTKHTLHQLPDFWKALALSRIASLMQTGGVLRIRDLIYDFHPDACATVFDRWLQGAPTNPPTGYTAADYIEHIRTEHSTFRWLFEPMLEAAGFHIVDAQFTGQVYGAYTCIKS